MIKWVILGKSSTGLVMERYFLRNWRTVCQVKDELRGDQSIRDISVISLCQLCGEPCKNGWCSNQTCVGSKRIGLPAPREAAVV